MVWKCFTSLDSQVSCSSFSCMEPNEQVAELQPSSATPWSCSCGRLGSARPTIVMPSSGNITTKYSKSIGSRNATRPPTTDADPFQANFENVDHFRNRPGIIGPQVDQNGNPWHRGMSTLSNFCRMADHIDISIGKIL